MQDHFFEHRSAECPKSARRITHTRAREEACAGRPEMLQQHFDRPERARIVAKTVADGDVGTAGEDWCNQAGDMLGGVLKIGVGIDHDVRITVQRFLDSRIEGGRQPHVPPQPYHAVGPGALRNSGRVIRGPVVDNHDLDRSNPGNTPRQRANRVPKRILFVPAGDLDHKFHGTTPVAGPCAKGCLYGNIYRIQASDFVLYH